MQGDAGTRKVTVNLFANREPWKPESNTCVAIRYHKPDGTGGTYDTLPNGETAWECNGTSVSFILAPQMLTVPGRVSVQVEFLREQEILASFPMEILVEKNVAAGAERSQNYFNWTHRLEEQLKKTLEEAKESGIFDGPIGATPELQVGQVTTVDAGKQAVVTILGQPERPVLDFEIPKGADAVVDTTLSVSGQAADAAAVAAALAGKSSVGYGLGEAAPLVTTFNYHGGCGFAEGTVDAPYHAGWCGINVSFGDRFLHGYQEITDVLINIGTKARREKRDGIWSAWEFFNPPMLAGVEYRTTERWLGKPVYTMLVDCGTLVGGTYATMPIDAYETLVRFAVTDGNAALPFIFSSMENMYTCWTALTSMGILYVFDTTTSEHNIKAQIWYTKQGVV